MSPSLSIECDPVDQPAAHDPVERRTWCALRIRVRGRTVTRLWDKALQEERVSVYLPAFPLAEWVVSHWWTLLNEPSPAPLPPRAAGPHHSWVKRHCFRAAEAGMLLPMLYLFSDGRGLCAAWQADERHVLSHMPGDFIDAGCEHLEQAAVEDALASFVTETLHRAASLDDERVNAVRENWQAIREADAEEVRFCVAAGRMGLDPYDSASLDQATATFLETALADPDLPVARDLTEAADRDKVAEQWQWVRHQATAWQLHALPKPLPWAIDLTETSSFRHGYRLAAQVRQAAGFAPTTPLASVAALAHALTGGDFRALEANHLSGTKVHAVVGWTGKADILLAGPRPARTDNQRFLEARGLYHALFACERSERLVTRAYTWDQQASRAFAAELLAPQAALLARARGYADRTMVEGMAQEYGASSVVVEKQLENAGVTLVDE